MITPDGSAVGVLVDEPQSSSSTGSGRPGWVENRRDQHLAANHEVWENETIGEALYQRTHSRFYGTGETIPAEAKSTVGESGNRMWKRDRRR